MTCILHLQDADACSECKNSKFLNPDLWCEAECPTGYYKAGVCCASLEPTASSKCRLATARLGTPARSAQNIAEAVLMARRWDLGLFQLEMEQGLFIAAELRCTECMDFKYLAPSRHLMREMASDVARLCKIDVAIVILTQYIPIPKATLHTP